MQLKELALKAMKIYEFYETAEDVLLLFDFLRLVGEATREVAVKATHADVVAILWKEVCLQFFGLTLDSKGITGKLNSKGTDWQIIGQCRSID